MPPSSSSATPPSVLPHSRTSANALTSATLARLPHQLHRTHTRCRDERLQRRQSTVNPQQPHERQQVRIVTLLRPRHGRAVDSGTLRRVRLREPGRLAESGEAATDYMQDLAVGSVLDGYMPHMAPASLM